MATWWVRADGGGSDAVPPFGTSYAQAWATIAYALAYLDGNLSAGDTLNIVNDGVHDLTGCTTMRFVNGAAGTGWDSGNWGFRIRGTDTNGDPAMAECQIPNTNGTYHWMRPQVGSSYFLVEGLKFTEAAGAAANNNVSLKLMEHGTACGDQGVRVRYCHFDFGSAGQSPAGSRWIIFKDSDPGSMMVDHCYIRNAQIVAGRGGVSTPSSAGIEISDNVYVMDEDDLFGSGEAIGEGTLQSGETYTFERNTVACLITNTATTFEGLPVIAHISASANNGTGVAQDNLYFIGTRGDGSNISTPPAVPVPFGYFGAHTYAFNNSTVDYNAFIITPACTGSLAGDFPYNEPFDSGGNYKTNDVSAFTYDTTEVFNDITSAYTWTVGSYTIDLDYDLRPKLPALLTGASDGAYIGALEGANQPPVAGNVTYTVTAGDTLSATAGDGVLSNSSDPDLDTLTASLVTSVTHGTLDTFNTTTGAFSYTPNTTFSGTDYFTFKVTDGLTFSASASAIITVDEYPVTPPGPEPDYTVDNVVDSLPFFAPDLKVETQLTFLLKKNRRRAQDFRHYVEPQLWSETTDRIIQITAGTTTAATTELNLGGVATAEFLLVETDNPIEVAVNDSTNYWPVDAAVMLSLSSVSHVYVRNSSSTEPTVTMVACN